MLHKPIICRITLTVLTSDTLKIFLTALLTRLSSIRNFEADGTETSIAYVISGRQNAFSRCTLINSDEADLLLAYSELYDH